MSNADLVRRRLELFNRKDVAGLSEVLAEDVVVHFGTDVELRGIAALGDTLHAFQGIDFNAEIATLLDDGDRVAARYVITGKHNGDFMGIPATGKEVRFGGAAIHRIAAGKIVETWHIEDVLSLMRQLGVVPVPPGSAPNGDVRASTGSTATTREENEQLTRGWIDLANVRDYDGLREVWDENLVLHQGEDISPLVGFEAFKHVLETFYEGIPDLHIQVHEVVGENDTVIVRSTSSGTHTGSLMGVAGTGKKVRFAGLGTFRIADGLIVEEWFNDDVFFLLQQIGLVPGP